MPKQLCSCIPYRVLYSISYLDQFFRDQLEKNYKKIHVAKCIKELVICKTNQGPGKCKVSQYAEHCSRCLPRRHLENLTQVTATHYYLQDFYDKKIKGPHKGDTLNMRHCIIARLKLLSKMYLALQGTCEYNMLQEKQRINFP